MRPKEHKQCQRIFGLAKLLGLDNGLLHERVYEVTGKESIKQLSFYEAEAVIKNLEGYCRPEAKSPAKKKRWKQYAFGFSFYRPGMATPSQLEFIRAMMLEMQKLSPGEASLDDRLRGWLQKYGKVDDLVFLDVRNARNIIDGMKNYLKSLGWEYKGDRIKRLEKEASSLQEKLLEADGAQWAELKERLTQVERELDVLRIHRG